MNGGFPSQRPRNEDYFTLLSLLVRHTSVYFHCLRSCRHIYRPWLIRYGHCACTYSFCCRKNTELCHKSRTLWQAGRWPASCECFPDSGMERCLPRWSWMLEKLIGSWWRHQMGTFSALLALCAGNSPVSGEFPSQRPVTRSFDVFFYLRPNKRLSKQ